MGSSGRGVKEWALSIVSTKGVDVFTELTKAWQVKELVVKKIERYAFNGYIELCVEMTWSEVTEFIMEVCQLGSLDTWLDGYKHSGYALHSFFFPSIKQILKENKEDPYIAWSWETKFI